eukprot:TRINITY_DN62767_c0_g1_i1.p1 TRINITY_DN62767_c0_g1~~TRINITY_DN62767_c0_g1_i1.p1  ORF type:complete len:297 (+),score=60.54 TRINITY_DN62767_c0_g1_i1:47-937(+)
MAPPWRRPAPLASLAALVCCFGPLGGHARAVGSEATAIDADLAGARVAEQDRERSIGSSTAGAGAHLMRRADASASEAGTEAERLVARDRELRASLGSFHVAAGTHWSAVYVEGRGRLVPGVMRHHAQFRRSEEQTASALQLESRHGRLAAHDAPPGDGEGKPQNYDVYYTIRGREGGFCSDNVWNITCTSDAVGQWEQFQIFFWSRVPNLHVIKGGNHRGWCRDHGKFLSCNKHSLTETEEYLFTKQENEAEVAMEGHEMGRWCRTTPTGLLACDSAEMSNANMVFQIAQMPNPE